MDKSEYRYFLFGPMSYHLKLPVKYHESDKKISAMAAGMA